MKLIGYWIRSLDDNKFPPPQELVTDYEPSTQRLIADYLDAGSTFAVYRGLSWCRFFCDHPMGNSELTDGEWVWPQDLSHYVRDHNVRLPDEFIQCARSKPAPVPPDNGWPSIIPDESFWITWCAENRSNSLETRIRTARTRAEAEAQRIKARTIAEREQTEGLSEITCQRAGCNNRALAGRVLCASCILESELSWRLAEPFMDLRPVLDA